MKWADSLIRIANFEVENLQKRVAEIVARRDHAEMRLMMLQAEEEAEVLRARQDAAAGWYLAGFRQGLALRKAKVQSEIDAIKEEETGARDALSRAFEELKKYEHVAEAAKLKARREDERRDVAALDELGLRKAAAGR